MKRFFYWFVVIAHFLPLKIGNDFWQLPVQWRLGLLAFGVYWSFLMVTALKEVLKEI